MLEQTYNVGWDITPKCNYSCKHCSAFQFAPSEHQQLSFESIRKIINNLDSSATYNFTILGGEPLVRSDLIKIIDELRHVLKVASITIATNGSLLNKFGLHLLREGININVSYEGVTPNSHDSIRGTGSFSEVDKNVRHLCDRSRCPTDGKLTINYTFTTLSENPLVILNYANSVSVDAISFFVAQKIGNAKRNTELIPNAAEIVKFTEDLLISKSRYDFPISLAYLKPLFVKYLNLKFNLSLPLRYSGCSALATDFIISDQGHFAPCRGIAPETKVYNELGFIGFDLTELDLIGAITSKPARLFIEQKNPGVYDNYIPCRACEFAGIYCDPCWLGLDKDNLVANGLCAHVFDQTINA